MGPLSATAVAAREHFRLDDGRFGEQGHTDPGQLSLGVEAVDLSTVDGVAELALLIRTGSPAQRGAIMAHVGIDPDGPYADESLVRVVGAAIAGHAQHEAGVPFDDLAAGALVGRDEKDLLARRAREAQAAYNGLKARVEQRSRADPRVQQAWARFRAASAAATDVSFSDMARTEYEDQVRAVVEADPDFRLAEEARDASQRLWADYTAHDGGACRAELSALAVSYRRVLAQVRPLGGRLEFHPKTSRKAAEAFAEAASWYPSDWVEASNADALGLLAKVGKRRAHYTHGHHESTRRREPLAHLARMTTQRAASLDSDPETDLVAWEPGMEPPYGYGAPRDLTGDPIWVEQTFEVHNRYARPEADPDRPPRGPGWQLWTDPHDRGRTFWRRPRTHLVPVSVQRTGEITTHVDPDPLAGNSPTLSTSVHEFAHRAEYTTKGITAVEAQFLARRAADSPLVNLYPGRSGAPEMGRSDHFVDAYIGKDYGGAAHEVLSCGTQALFGGAYGGLAGAGRYRVDAEHRDLVLGILATV